MSGRDLLDRVIGATEQYLGPTAERFVRRQIVFHLNKDPQSITTEDVPKIAEWIKVTMGLLTEDKAMVNACEAKILQLADNKVGQPAS